jgi:hypothetical protein
MQPGQDTAAAVEQGLGTEPHGRIPYGLQASDSVRTPIGYNGTAQVTAMPACEVEADSLLQIARNICASKHTLQNVQLVPLIHLISGIIVYILQKIALRSSFDFNSFN